MKYQDEFSNTSYEKITPTNDNKKIKDYWDIGIGLNEVDRLKPSKYLYEVMEKNVKGEISIYDAQTELKQYYEKQSNINHEEMECDLVSARIVEYLDIGGFTFSPPALKGIHRYLFQGLNIIDEKYVGVYRDYNISKKEYILNGNTVVYGNCNEIEDLLSFEFMSERQNKYKFPYSQKEIEKLSFFTTRIWEVHPFVEGNTRTTALFIQKYLTSKGFPVNNDLFKKNSLYFRNALVRNCYEDKEVIPTDKYLNMFFENLLLKKSNILDNKELYVDRYQK